MLSIRQRLHIVAISIGLFGCYSIFGILQERIFRKGFLNDDGTTDQFTYPVSFACLQCIFYSLIAKGKFHWTNLTDCAFIISLLNSCSSIADPRALAERDESKFFCFHCRLFRGGNHHIKCRVSIYIVSKSSRWKRFEKFNYAQTIFFSTISYSFQHLSQFQ